jgi:hypothetical protein
MAANADEVSDDAITVEPLLFTLLFPPPHPFKNPTKQMVSGMTQLFIDDFNLSLFYATDLGALNIVRRQSIQSARCPLLKALHDGRSIHSINGRQLTPDRSSRREPPYPSEALLI